jgi:RHS repeat-associated protein
MYLWRPSVFSSRCHPLVWYAAQIMRLCRGLFLLVTDSGGNPSAQMGQFPFGESWYNATGDKLQFSTYERDSESVNDYALARYQVNRLGRFSSPDPLAGGTGDPQSLNRYAYTRNDPVDYVDPTGMYLVGLPNTPGGAPGPANGGGFNPFDPTGNGSIWSAALNGSLFNVIQYDFSALADFHWGEFDLSELRQFAIENEISLSVTSLGVAGFFGQGPGPSVGGGTAGKAKDVIKAALKQANLSKCLHHFFGKGNVLTNANLPSIDATQDLGGAGEVHDYEIPVTGRGSVYIDKGIFTRLRADDPYLVGTYLHETANVLAIQRFTNIQPRAARPYMGPLGGPLTAPQNNTWDHDIGQQFEKCIFP